MKMFMLIPSLTMNGARQQKTYILVFISSTKQKIIFLRKSRASIGKHITKPTRAPSTVYKYAVITGSFNKRAKTCVFNF